MPHARPWPPPGSMTASVLKALTLLALLVSINGASYETDMVVPEDSFLEAHSTDPSNPSLPPQRGRQTEYAKALPDVKKTDTKKQVSKDVKKRGPRCPQGSDCSSKKLAKKACTAHSGTWSGSVRWDVSNWCAACTGGKYGCPPPRRPSPPKRKDTKKSPPPRRPSPPKRGPFCPQGFDCSSEKLAKKACTAHSGTWSGSVRWDVSNWCAACTGGSYGCSQPRRPSPPKRADTKRSPPPRRPPMNSDEHKENKRKQAAYTKRRLEITGTRKTLTWQETFDLKKEFAEGKNLAASMKKYADDLAKQDAIKKAEEAASIKKAAADKKAAAAKFAASMKKLAAYLNKKNAIKKAEEAAAAKKADEAKNAWTRFRDWIARLRSHFRGTSACPTC